MRSSSVSFVCLYLANILFAQSPPNHLEPMSIISTNGGAASAIDALIPHRPVELWVIAAPAFYPDYSLYIINSSKNPDTPNFQLRYYKASRNYLLLPPPPPPLPPGIKPPISQSAYKPPAKILRSVSLSPSFVAPISKVWARVLKRTRYSPDTHLYIGCDGCLYMFGQNGYIGITWSPSGEIPAKLVELSELLVELTATKGGSTDVLQAKAHSICAELSRALDSEAVPRWP